MQHQRHNPATAPGTSAKRDEGPGPLERSLEERLQFEEQLFELSARLINVPDSDLESDLQRTFV